MKQTLIFFFLDYSSMNDSDSDNSDHNNHNNHNPSENTHQLTLLEQLYDFQADNRVCADCGQQSPDWASLSLGILICIACSGVRIENCFLCVSLKRFLGASVVGCALVQSAFVFVGRVVAQRHTIVGQNRQSKRQKSV